MVVRVDVLLIDLFLNQALAFFRERVVHRLRTRFSGSNFCLVCGLERGWKERLR